MGRRIRRSEGEKEDNGSDDDSSVIGGTNGEWEIS
jgi:hypothetical protein